jgi:lysophospholipase L1-like esterase
MKKVLLSLSVALNVLLLCAVLALWLGGGALMSRFFLEPMHTRWTTQFEVLPVEAGSTVFLGDSITEGGIWEDLFPGVRVHNRGISGDTTEGVLARLEQVVSGKPAKVFLLIGTNDLSMEVPVETIVGNIERIVTRFQQGSPDTTVYVQSVLPRAAGYRDRVEALNGRLRDVVAGKAKWVDLYPQFLDPQDGSIRDEFSNDELHLLGGGYLVWRDAIAAHVRD